MNSKVRRASYDLLRIISGFSVILIHSNWQYFKDVYGEPNTSFSWICLSLINILTRFSVPAFVMMSGAFNLSNPENINISKYYKKCIKRVVFKALIAMLFLMLIQLLINVSSGDKIYKKIIGIFVGDFYALWFVYMLIGLYLMTPFIIRLKNNVSFKQYKTISIVMLVWAVVSQATSNQRISYSIGVVVAFLGYYLIGDVINTMMDNGSSPNRRMLYAMCVLSIICSFVFRYLGINYYTHNAYVNFFSPAIVIYSLAIFLLFGSANIKRDYSRMSNMIYEMYLFHMLVLRALLLIVNVFQIEIVWKVFMLAVGTFAVSLLFAIVYKKVYRSIINRMDNKIEEMKIWEYIA